MKRPRVAFVVSRCGTDIAGGAELQCLGLSERMRLNWDVEILTTTARDYVTWKNVYNPGIEKVRDVPVRRFPVTRQRNLRKFNRLSASLASRVDDVTPEEQLRWIREQGPDCPELTAYVLASSARYDAFIFFGYLYATTYINLPLVKRALLFPFVHDEWPLRMPGWRHLFAAAEQLLFDSIEEREFFIHRFPGLHQGAPVIGTGIEPQRGDEERFRNLTGIRKEFLLYIGRVDESKGVPELLRLFEGFRESCGADVDLVLIGPHAMRLTGKPWIHSLGYLADELKWDALAAASALVMPSLFESLSIVLLEAWASKKPVLVNAHTAVLIGQTRRAGGGLWYRTQAEFNAAVEMLLNPQVGPVLGLQGAAFVAEHYAWERVVIALERALRNLLTVKP